MIPPQIKLNYCLPFQCHLFYFFRFTFRRWDAGQRLALTGSATSLATSPTNEFPGYPRGPVSPPKPALEPLIVEKAVEKLVPIPVERIVHKPYPVPVPIPQVNC